MVVVVAGVGEAAYGGDWFLGGEGFGEHAADVGISGARVAGLQTAAEDRYGGFGEGGVLADGLARLHAVEVWHV